MSLLPGDATYAEVVTDYYLQFGRGGVALSPLDAQLLMAWQDVGIPVVVVTRGIKAAAEARQWKARPDDVKLHSLREAKRFVEAEWKLHLELTVGRGGGS